MRTTMTVKSEVESMPSHPRTVARAAVLNTVSAADRIRARPKKIAIPRSFTFSSRKLVGAGKRLKMLRTASRPEASQPRAVKRSPTAAMAPVQVRIPVEKSSSGLIAPSLPFPPIRPGTLERSRPRNAPSNSGFDRITKPAIANPTQIAANAAKMAWNDRPAAISGPLCAE